MEKIRQKRIPQTRETIKARLDREIAMDPEIDREKCLTIFRKAVKVFETMTKDMKDLVKLIRASSFTDLKGELSSLITLSLRGSDMKRRRAKIN